MKRRLILGATIAVASFTTLVGAAQAAPGSLRILVDQNIPNPDLPSALVGKPGVSVVDTFDSSVATPTAAQFASYDVVANQGDDTYADAALYGDRLATYLDGGGALIQFAYDNWNDPDASPTGRFVSGGYPPFELGVNVNNFTSLDTPLVPGSPLLANVSTFTTIDNTDDMLAPGATLLAKWTDGRNAIATKGQVVSATNSPSEGSNPAMIAASAQLTINTGNVLGPRTLSVTKAGTGTGTVTGGSVNCGSACSARVGGSQSLTLTATASKGTFTGWSGGGCSGTSTCKPNLVGGNATVTATFDACVVPKLKGKRLKKAKKKLRRRDCRLGKVKNKRSHGKVKKQKPKPGTVLPPDSKVKVTLR